MLPWTRAPGPSHWDDRRGGASQAAFRQSFPCTGSALTSGPLGEGVCGWEFSSRFHAFPDGGHALCPGAPAPHICSLPPSAHRLAVSRLLLLGPERLRALSAAPSLCLLCVCLSFWDEVCFSSSDRLARQTGLPFLFCFVFLSTAIFSPLKTIPGRGRL